jgi:hypothetical protein
MKTSTDTATAVALVIITTAIAVAVQQIADMRKMFTLVENQLKQAEDAAARYLYTPILCI